MLRTRLIHPGGVTVITPERLYRDHRGFFLDARRSNEYMDLTAGLEFVQSNFSVSVPFTLRGLHYQLGRPMQGKLLRCISGKIFQVSVDMRAGSPNFGTWAGTILDGTANESVWVPPGFANGFFAFEQGAVVHYDMTAYYSQELERAVRWDDPVIGIQWPMGIGAQVVLSAKDRVTPLLSEAEPWE